MTPDLATFCAHFRANVNSSLEYSVSGDTSIFGTMVRGDSLVLDRIRAFVLGTPFSGDWYVASERMFRQVNPTASLFRVDWRAQRAVATTLYLKFPNPPTDAEFAALLASARPSAWSGPSPIAMAEAVGLAGPTGIALRGVAAGCSRLAVYYQVEVTRGALGPGGLARLLKLGNFGCSAERIAADSVTLAQTSALSVIGPSRAAR
jgi:hypothetical protein